jgi:hypothetical protein
MVEELDPAPARQPQTVAQTMLLESIHAQLSTALAFCSVAETEARWGSAAEAKNILAIVLRATDQIQLDLEDPSQLPQYAVAELRDLLRSLNQRVEKIESVCSH